MRLELPGNPAGIPATSIEATVAELSEHLIWLECAPATLPALPASPLHAGMRVILRCWDAFGVYCAFTQIAEIATPTHIAIEATSPVEAGENRRFYRVHVEVPFVVARLGTSDPSIDSKAAGAASSGGAGGESRATSVDLSPGGLKFKTSTAFRLGDRLALRLPFAAQSIDLEGRVVRTHTPAQSDDWLISVEFVNTSDENQLKVIRLIYAEQQRAVRAAR